jgi:glycosyltransferase involved in cell wall biosynthesis
LGADIVLAYVTRAYPHKNVAFLGAVGIELRTRHELLVNFVVTLTHDEWFALDSDTREYCTNIGVQKIAQVPSLLMQVDGAFFPSLLEAFSVTPLEAMALQLPLFASDRDFVRTICGDYPHYFDPEDPSAAAKVIADWSTTTCGALPDAPAHTSLGWSAKDRAETYASIISDALA